MRAEREQNAFHTEQHIVTGSSELLRPEHPQVVLGLTPKNLV